jgi:hypothetical protein
MVQAFIEIPQEVNHILNIVKARYNLKTKSEAIAKIVIECGESILEPDIRPDYKEKLKNIEKKGKFLKFKSADEIKKSMENA